MTDEAATVRPDQLEDTFQRFMDFFKSFRSESGSLKYREIIQRLPVTGGRSVVVDFNELLAHDPQLARQIIEDPEPCLKSASDAVKSIVDLEDRDYVSKIIESGFEFKARLRNVSTGEVKLRMIRAIHIGKLIMVRGIVTRVSEVKPQLVVGIFECASCGEKIPIPQVEGRFTPPSRCSNPKCGREGPFMLVVEDSKFVDWQKLRIQEMPEELPPGQMPRSIDIIAKDDLVDTARPGDRVAMIGPLISVQDFAPKRGRLTTFRTFIDANYVDTKDKESEKVEITPEEERVIIDLAKDEWIYQKIIKSIAPSIYGLEDIKEAIALALFGGVPKTLPDGVKVRGEINVLLVGDPGTAKSQLLMYTAELAPRGLYTSGKGSSAAGLTAAVMRDSDTGDMTLEAGALVLADRGVACVDEFDKMNPQDRVAIHQAMEQQSYHPRFEIALANGSRIPIGELVDSLFLEHGSNVVQGVNCEILDTRPLDLEVFTTDFQRIEQVHVDRVSRHPSPDHFFRVCLSNGREILVTPDHPFFVFQGTTMITTPAEKLKVGDFVPSFHLMPCGHNPGAVLTHPALVHFNAKKILLPGNMTPKLARLLGYFVSEGFTHFGSSAELGFSNTFEPIIDDITALMRELFGLEGTNYVDKDRSIRYISAQLRDLLKLNFPQILARATRKRAPPQLFTSGRLIVVAFLQSAFLGDGSVESESICFRTSSNGLACDYQDLLLCAGIQSRIAHDASNDSYKVYICGGSLPLFYDTIVESWDPRRDRVAGLAKRSEVTNRNHDVFPPGIGTRLKRLYKLVGRPYRGTFHWAIENEQGITRLLLKSCLAEIRNAFSRSKTLLDASPETVRDARRILNWSQDITAKRIGVSRSFIDYAERDGYSPEIRQDLVGRIVRAIRETCDSIEVEIKKVDSLLQSDMCFLRARKVERVRNKDKWFCPFVYDVTVEPNHCFVSQGVVLHNTISIAKAGIVATLNARTAILAAANPAFGRYNAYKNPAENISLPVTVLSRFDLIFVITDKPESERDRRMAEHVLSLHSSKGAGLEAPIFPQLLRKYISYAKRNFTPSLTAEAAKKIQEFYLETRAMGENPESPVPITARQLEALVRLAEARAKMGLKKEITVEDADAVIRLMNASLKQVGIDRETGRSDIDTIMVGRTKSQRERIDLILRIVNELSGTSKEGFIPVQRIIDAAISQGVEEQYARDSVDKLLKEGVLFSSSKPGFVKKV